MEWCIRQTWRASVILYYITGIAYKHHTDITLFYVLCFISTLLQGLLKKSKPYYKRTQESLLTFVVWASFCNTFYNKVEIAGLDVFLVVLLVIGTQLLVYVG